MKRILTIFLIVFLTLSFNLLADYTSPGTGVAFNLDSLVVHSAGAVTSDSANFYINQSILISTTDTLTINRGKNIVFTDIAGNVELDINGALFANGIEEDSIIFTSQNHTAGDYYGIRFRNTITGSDFQMRYCRIEYATRAIRVTSADAIIENSLIQKSSEAAVDFYSSNSTISNCIIHNNRRYAITLSNDSSPLIEGNTFTQNNYQNSSPLATISIGLQGINSPIIKNNTIIGTYEMSGAIGVWLNSNAIIKNNTIENCGYGILCLDQNANPYIKNNTIRNNTIHPDTLNWGFAIWSRHNIP